MRTLFPASPVSVELKLVYRSYSFFPQEEEAEVVCLQACSFGMRCMGVPCTVPVPPSLE